MTDDDIKALLKFTSERIKVDASGAAETAGRFSLVYENQIP